MVSLKPKAINAMTAQSVMMPDGIPGVDTVEEVQEAIVVPEKIEKPKIDTMVRAAPVSGKALKPLVIVKETYTPLDYTDYRTVQPLKDGFAVSVYPGNNQARRSEMRSVKLMNSTAKQIGVFVTNTDRPPRSPIFVPAGNSPNEPLLTQQLKNIFNKFLEVFAFKDESILKALMSVFLIRDGSVILWGVPGTGKTTLIECLTMVLCNDLDYSEGRTYNFDVLDRFIKSSYGTLGLATYNQSKEPTDVFYDLSIEIKQTSPTEVKPAIGGEETVGFQRYDIRPAVKPIVTSAIKFHNEFNRSNEMLQDVMLRLLSEKELEFKGMTFQSPDGITIFDGNRYITLKRNIPLDEALMDRITVSIVMPNVDAGGRVMLLGSGKKEPREQINDMINGREIEPLTYEELQWLWASIDQSRHTDGNIIFKLSGKSIDLITVVLSYFATGYRGYETMTEFGDQFKGSYPVRKLEYFNGQENVELPAFVDEGDVLFFSAVKNNFHVGTELKPDGEGNMDSGDTELPSEQQYIDMLGKQIGHRAFKAFVNFAKAYMFFQFQCLNDGAILPIGGYDLNKETILKLLRYVVGHRLGFEPSTGFSQAIPNFEMFIDGPFSSLIVDKRFDNWNSALTLSYQLQAEYMSTPSITIMDAMTKYDKGIGDVVYPSGGGSINIADLKDKYKLDVDMLALRQMHLARLKMIRKA